MSTTNNTAISSDRISRRQVDKFAERRRQLAEAALTTLSELGYARTSLREIANNSEFTHGVLHYYFRDKVDLITQCVRQYKERCITRYDEIVATATTARELRLGFASRMGETLVEEAPFHRLWYDLRSQSLFESSFRDDITAIDGALENMIWRVVTRYADLDDRTLTVSPAFAYATFDGIFQQALVSLIGGDVTTPATLADNVNTALNLVGGRGGSDLEAAARELSSATTAP